MQEQSKFTDRAAEVRRRKRVLFIGYGNSCRSQMAEAFARHYGMGFLDAQSVGLEPDEQVTPQARALMAERGVPLPDVAFPKSLSAVDLSGFDLTVFLTEFDIPMEAEGMLKIQTPDTRNVSDEILRRVRAEIEARVIDAVYQLRPKPLFRPILLTYRDVHIQAHS